MHIFRSAPPAVSFRIAWLRMLRDARMEFPERCRQTAAEFGVAPADLRTDMHDMLWLVVLAGAVLGRTADSAADARLSEFVARLENDGNVWLAARARALTALHLLKNGDAAAARGVLAPLVDRNDTARLILDLPPLADLLGSHDPPAIPDEPLTQRERDILALLCSDRVNKEIAYTLSISIHTLYTHLRSIYRKLSVHSREEAVRVWGVIVESQSRESE